MAFGRLPDRGRIFLAPPFLTRTLATMKPGLALYPTRLALSNRVGRSSLCTDSPLRHPMAISLIHAEKDLSDLLHA